MKLISTKNLIWTSIILTGFITSSAASAGCTFELYLKNRTGTTIDVKDVKYKLPKTLFASWESHSGGQFEINSWSEKERSIFNGSVSCDEQQKWKYKYKCEGSNSWHLIETDKWRSDTAGSTAVYQEDINGCNGDQDNAPLGLEVSVSKGQLTDAGACLTDLEPTTLLDNGMAHLKWTADGSLVVMANTALFPGEQLLWSTNTDYRGLKTCFKDNGNLTIYDSYDETNWRDRIWRSNTLAETLILQDDCNLVIKDSSGSILWDAGISAGFCTGDGVEHP